MAPLATKNGGNPPNAIYRAQARKLNHRISGERKDVRLEFGCITGKDDLRTLKAARKKIKTKIVASYKDFVKKP